jgi:hypothetical protein
MAKVNKTTYKRNGAENICKSMDKTDKFLSFIANLTESNITMIRIPGAGIINPANVPVKRSCPH